MQQHKKGNTMNLSVCRGWIVTLILTSVLVEPSAMAGRNLYTFTFSSNAEAQQAWIPGEDAKNVWSRQDRSGLVFPCPFTRNVDRYYWDLTCRLDLSQDSSLILDMSCENPEAARTLSIYFKSGDGWYHWSRPIRGGGRQRVAMVKSECDIEGTPIGWHHIDGIRFSPWKGSSIDTDFVLHSLQSQTDRLLLVQATSSAESQADRDLSRRTTRIVSRLLDDAGLEYGTLDDDAVVRGALRHARLAVLCYNPNPSPAMMKQLRAFTQSGGKLVVFGSSHRALADLMGVRLGTFLPSGRPGRWTSMRFSPSRAKRAPKVVNQVAWGMTPAVPAHARTHVLASWSDAQGITMPEAAWLEGPHGAWMTQILRDDDMAAKARMLVAIFGRYDEDLWRQAARHSMKEAGRVGPYTGLQDAVPAFRASARTRPYAKRAKELHRVMSQQFAAGNYPDTVETASRLHHELLKAYGTRQETRRSEFRGVWDHDGAGWYPGDWKRTCRVLNDAGLNAVFPNVMWAGKAHYPSRHLPGSKTLDLFGDQLAQCVSAADACGIEVHAWKVCWNLGNAPPDFVATMKKEGRLQQQANGSIQNWLCPSHPRNLQHELNAIEEVARNYDVDGIHLDYIRFPSVRSCYDPTCRRAFEKHLGRTSTGWPKSVQEGGRDQAAFRTWRAAQITSFVRSVRVSLRRINPKLDLSAAVYRRYPSCRDSLGQDWGRWLEEDLVDFVCPMSYTEDTLNFTNVTRDQLALPRAAGRVMPGIGVTSSESQLQPDQVIDQVQALRRQGATGFVLFDLGSTLRDEVLPILKLGTTAP